VNSIGSAGVADEQGAPPRSPPRFQFPIWHLVMLALLCAFVAASLRSSKVALIPAFGAILALLFFVIPKTQSVEGAGSLVPSLFAAVGVGLVCAAYYLFSPAHRTYSSLALGLLLVYYAFLPWVMLRLVNSAVLSLLVAAGVGLSGPLATSSRPRIGPISPRTLHFLFSPARSCRVSSSLFGAFTKGS
jgi:hypothetical protein